MSITKESEEGSSCLTDTLPPPYPLQLHLSLCPSYRSTVHISLFYSMTTMGPRVWRFSSSCWPLSVSITLSFKSICTIRGASLEQTQFLFFVGIRSFRPNEKKKKKTRSNEQPRSDWTGIVPSIIHPIDSLRAFEKKILFRFVHSLNYLIKKFPLTMRRGFF